MNKLSSNIVFTGDFVTLEPLKKEHFEELIYISKNEQIWEFNSQNCFETDILISYLNEGLTNRDMGIQYPFVIKNADNESIVGTTRYGNIDLANKKLEIGWTWLAPEVWGKGYNDECKLLLLTYAFETLGAVRVELKTWDRNLRSRRAIERIGGTFEGVLRNHMINYNGTIRSSAYYSFIIDEWMQKKSKLEEQVKNKLRDK